jgi:hypothetical protein
MRHAALVAAIRLAIAPSFAYAVSEQGGDPLPAAELVSFRFGAHYIQGNGWRRDPTDRSTPVYLRKRSGFAR